MAENVLSLAEHRPAVNGDAVRKLERALEMARSGEIDGVALAYSTRDGWGGQGYSTAANSVLLLGAIGILQARYASHLAATSEDVQGQ